MHDFEFLSYFAMEERKWLFRIRKIDCRTKTLANTPFNKLFITWLCLQVPAISDAEYRVFICIAEMYKWKKKESIK